VTITTQNLSVKLGTAMVVQDAGLTFQRGRVTAILGPNGAGKSSLVRALCGLMPPTAGSVRIDGHDLSTLALLERAKRIGYLPQDSQPSWAITAQEMVEIGRLPHRSRFAAPNAADQDAVEQAMRDTETLALADRRIDTLSGGECARVKIARVFASNCDWIIADEPLANLDPPHQRDLLALFKQAAKTGKGVILVLHQINAAARVADDILILKSGSVVASGPSQDVLTSEILESTFGMPFERVAHGDSFAILPRA
jgi:iron complex transport system ATP-binding protein